MVNKSEIVADQKIEFFSFLEIKYSGTSYIWLLFSGKLGCHFNLEES